MVPCGFHTSDAAAALIVHMRVAVEYFEKLVVLNLSQFLSRNRPAKVGMVDMRNSLHLPYGVDIALQSVDDRGSRLRRHQFSHVQSVQVERLVAELVCNFFAFDYQKALVSAMQRV